MAGTRPTPPYWRTRFISTNSVTELINAREAANSACFEAAITPAAGDHRRYPFGNLLSNRKPRRIRLMRWPIIAVILVIAAGVALYNSPGWQLGRAYNQLQIGMSKSQVRNLFNRKPDYECKLRSSDIWYIRAPGFFTGDFSEVDEPSGSIYQSTKELPDIYDHVQLAFDSDDRLHAFTWIGETYTVESTIGSTPGSHFKVLADFNF